jgi:SAM-dependent methyltransferase
MPTIIEDVSKLYGNIAQLENRRLIDHPMERELTLRAIRKALAASPSGPTNPKRIADIGGGPGKLAFLLADEGHHVDLVDLSPDLIQLAQAEQDRRRALHKPNTNTDTTDTITTASTTTSTTTSTTYTGNNTGTNTNNNKPALLRSISTGNALTLDTHPLLGTNSTPNSNGTYDAVLLLGPLYRTSNSPSFCPFIARGVTCSRDTRLCARTAPRDSRCPTLGKTRKKLTDIVGTDLLEEPERATAVTQALRLAKPGGQGVVFVAFVSVAAHLRDVAVREPGRLVERGEFYGKYVSFSLFSLILIIFVLFLFLSSCLILSLVGP